MPEILIYAAEGRSHAQKAAVVRDVTEAITRHFGVDKDVVVISFIETPKTNKARGGKFYSELQAIPPARTDP